MEPSYYSPHEITGVYPSKAFEVMLPGEPPSSDRVLNVTLTGEGVIIDAFELSDPMTIRGTFAMTYDEFWDYITDHE